MGELGKKLRNQEGGHISFWCPGCNEPHTVNQGWAFNGNYESPTFSPSILVRSGHFARPGEPCWCTYNTENPENPSGFSCSQCHSFVENGQIRFLDDCTHNLKGKTVELMDWPDL